MKEDEKQKIWLLGGKENYFRIFLSDKAVICFQKSFFSYYYKRKRNKVTFIGSLNHNVGNHQGNRFLLYIRVYYSSQQMYVLIFCSISPTVGEPLLRPNISQGNQPRA